MNAHADLGSMEREAYRAYWSDGIVDLYLGASLLFFGAMWTWVNDLSGIAGLLPAVLVTPMLALHNRFVGARLGYVEWRPDRRRWERRNLVLLLAAGVGLLLLVVLLQAEPGWPMLACGVVATIIGLVMLRRFVERYPVIEAA